MTTTGSLVLAAPMPVAVPTQAAAVAFRLAVAVPTQAAAVAFHPAADPNLVVVVAFRLAAVPTQAVGACLLPT